MRRPRAVLPPERSGPHDPELEAALRQVLQVVFKEHPLSANQLLVLAAELQRIGMHRLVEEHLTRAQARTAG